MTEGQDKAVRPPRTDDDRIVESLDRALAPIARRLARILTDLDRCAHGRHQGDPCVGCPEGVSPGNPHLVPGDVIGYDIAGDPYIVPLQRPLADPAGWRPAP